MKLTKKLASLALALLMICALSANVFATETGSITIKGIGLNTSTSPETPLSTYSIYKILDLDRYDAVNDKYIYKYTTDAWKDFFETGAGKDYIAPDANGILVWKTTDDATTINNFATAALAYAKANSISPVKTTANTADYTLTGTNLTFSGLDLGYYLIDSTMGALCGLTTTNPDVSFNAKNVSPTIDKQVKEDSTGNWGDQNTAEVGQIVEYRTTINVHDGAQKYVLHDTMSAGLTFTFNVSDTTGANPIFRVEHVPSSGTPHTATHGTHYTVVTTGLTDGCTFEVRFTDDFCKSLKTNDKVIVYYQAKLNENAQIGNSSPDTNSTQLQYGEANLFTSEDIVKTYTYGFDLVKTDDKNVLLPGASFKIYTAATGGNEVAVTKQSDGTYLRTPASDIAYNETNYKTSGGNIIEVTGGKVRVEGFDNGTYYLQEITAPEGYNPLAARQEFTISDNNLDAEINAGNIVTINTGVHVVNRSGAMLPSTGGIGTTIFYASGAALALGAVILLVTKKRMGAGE